MARHPSKCSLHSLNAVYMIFALALVAGAIWFFVEVTEFTNLRNSNHYLLDYNVYWPQATPWIFIVVGVIAVCVSCCGFSGVRREKKGLITIYNVFQGITIILLIAAAIIALVFADSKATDDFINDTIWDAYFQSKSEKNVEAAFSIIERRLHCCGSESPRDYKNWKNEFPPSCCDTYYHGWIGQYVLDCDFTNKLANERHGCVQVATQYSRIFIKVLSAVSLFTALIGIIALVLSAMYAKALRPKPRVINRVETESNKGLL